MVTKKAFTLIEVMIAIVIMVVLTMMSYAPYNYYQSKAKLKMSSREVSQLLYESRNMAVSWAVWNWKNISVWVYFDSSLEEKTKIKVFSYPYDVSFLNLLNIEWWDTELLKTHILKNGIQLDDISGKENMLFVFDAISWNVKYYTWESWNKTEVISDNIYINMSYKWSTSTTLKKTLSYFTSTNIIDY